MEYFLKRFDNHQTLLTASYYIQKLFMNLGDRQLLCTMSGDPTVGDWSEGGELTTGEVYFKSNRSNVEYTDILIEDANNNILGEVDYCHIDKDSDEFYIGKAEGEEYTISFKAKQTGDKGEGFLMHFGRKDKDNMLSLTLGGWNKANNALLEVINGRGSCLSQYPFPLVIGKTYSVRIDVAGRQVVVTIDGVEYQRIPRKHILVEPLYSCASVEDTTGDELKVTKQKYSHHLELSGKQLHQM